MNMNKKQVLCVVVASVLTLSLVLLPVLALAQTDPVEPDLFEEYDVQGYDADGNAVLTNEDYEDYINKMLAEMAADDTGTVKKN